MVLRNSRFLIALLLATACVGFLAGIGFALIGVGSFEHGFSVSHLLDALLWAGAGVVSISGGVSLWRLCLRMAKNTVRLTDEGVYFHFASHKPGEGTFFRWEEVLSIAYDRSTKAQICTVSATGGRIVRFSSLTFLRPKRVARLIAERAGRKLA